MLASVHADPSRCSAWQRLQVISSFSAAKMFTSSLSFSSTRDTLHWLQQHTVYVSSFPDNLRSFPVFPQHLIWYSSTPTTQSVLLPSLTPPHSSIFSSCHVTWYHPASSRSSRPSLSPLFLILHLLYSCHSFPYWALPFFLHFISTSGHSFPTFPPLPHSLLSLPSRPAYLTLLHPLAEPSFLSPSLLCLPSLRINPSWHSLPSQFIPSQSILASCHSFPSLLLPSSTQPFSLYDVLSLHVTSLQCSSLFHLFVPSLPHTPSHSSPPHDPPLPSGFLRPLISPRHQVPRNESQLVSL